MYLYFISTQLDQIICDETQICYGNTFYMYILTIFALPICWIETYTLLSYLSISGIILVSMGILAIFDFCGEQIIHGDRRD
jgi:hypothetical protein